MSLTEGPVTGWSVLVREVGSHEGKTRCRKRGSGLHSQSMPLNSARCRATALISPALFVAVLGMVDRAEAFCVLRTCNDEQCQQSDGCIVEGHPLYWDSKCLTYGVSALNTSALNLTPEEFRDIVEDAFKVWENVDCGDGKRPGFSARSVGIVESNGNFFCEEEPFANLPVWSLVTKWERPSNALGYASTMYNKRNGEIFDADVDLNVNKVKLDYRNDPTVYPVVLGRIVVHEAGHFLGLAHTPDHDAVMFGNYSPLDLFTRELTQNDIDGICALYPPDDGLECGEPGYVEAALNKDACDAATTDRSSGAVSCSMAHVPARGGAWAWLGASVLVGLLNVRRRALG